MNIIIVGAGEVGRQLAETLCMRENNVVVVDISAKLLRKLRDRLDVMTVTGDCANLKVLKNANLDTASLLIAASGSDASNILACKIARHFKVPKTICRLSSDDFFSEKDGFPARTSGIDHIILPVEECVAKILGVLENRSVVEKLSFIHPDAQISAIRVTPDSNLAGLRLVDFPDPELLREVRFSAIIRDQRLLVPYGDTIFTPGDEVYVAGKSDHVDAIIRWANPDASIPGLVVVAGATSTAHCLVRKLLDEGYTVRVIERDLDAAERMLEDIGGGKVMFINGGPTENDILDEAGVEACGAFISALLDDEENILSCILAKKKGARKVISVTNKAEYRDIVPALKNIDCGFSPRLVAVNSVLNLLGNETGRVHAILHRFHAYVYEFEVGAQSPVCGKRIAECAKIPSAIFALVFRQGQLIPATGDVVFEKNDQVAAVATPEIAKSMEPLFRKRKFSG